jgi:tetratricopeptide (TPR) repeat protein/predicted Ser/Thr protein kinase
MLGGFVGCIEPELVLAYLGGRAPQSAARIEAHVDTCADCRAWMAHLARTSLLAESVTDDEEPVPLGEFLPAGTEVGRYRIVKVLGRGGMGVVYEARDPTLRRSIALKVLRSALVEAMSQRLGAEAQAMARLSHPNVRAVYDVGAVGGRPFIAMELVEGSSLAEWLAAEPRTAREILSVFAAAGRGLAAVHDLGIAHRDFKPSNVLVAEGGRVLVSDFGLAASIREETMPGGGTPRYMAPEQREGKADARADQYSFAVALEEALAGHRSFRRLRAALQRARRAEPTERHASMRPLLDALAAGRSHRLRRAGLAASGLVAVFLVIPRASSQPLLAPAAGTEALATAAWPETDPRVRPWLDAAAAHDREGEYEEALAALDEALRESDARGDEAGRAKALAGRGRTLDRLGHGEDAAAVLEDAFLLATRIGRDDIAAEAAAFRIGVLSQSLGRTDEALQWGRHAEAALERGALSRPERAHLHASMAGVHSARGEYGQARDRHRQAYDICRAEYEGDHPRTAMSLANLANAEGYVGDMAQAKRLQREAIAMFRRLHREEHPDVASSLLNLAVLLARDGDLTGAQPPVEEALGILERTLGPNHPLVGTALTTLGGIRIDAGDPEGALVPLRRAVEIIEPQHPYAIHLHNNLGVSLAALGRCSEALVHYREAVRLAEANETLTAAASPYLGIAECALEARDYATAVSAAHIALAYELPSDPARMARDADVLARALAAASDPAAG